MTRIGGKPAPAAGAPSSMSIAPTRKALAGRPSAKIYRISNVRNRLLDSAVAELEGQGPHHLNLRAIAARAGVAPSTVYYHYKNKEDLLGWLAQAGFEALRAA